MSHVKSGAHIKVNQGSDKSKEGNPLSFATEIIIEIKQFNAGRIASHTFIECI